MNFLLLLATVYKMHWNADPGSWGDRLPAGTFEWRIV